MSSIFVIAFDPRDPSRVQNTRLYLWKPANDVDQHQEWLPSFIAKHRAPDYLVRRGFYEWRNALDVDIHQEGLPHWIAKHRPPDYLVRRGFYEWRNALDVDQHQEGLPHFIAKFQPPTYLTKQQYNWNAALDVDQHQEGLPSFIARLQPPTYFTKQQYNWVTAQDTSAPTAAAEAQPHFIAKFQPPNYLVSPGQYNWITAQDTSAPGADAPNGFSPTFIQAQSLPPDGYLLWNPAQDTSSVVVPAAETQPHFIGRFQSAQYLVKPGLYNWIAATDIPPLADAAGGFAANFIQGQILPPYGYLLWNSAQDTSSAVVPADGSSGFSPQFIQGQFLPPDGYLLWGSAQDTSSVVVVAAETQPHFIARFQPTKYTIPPGFGLYNFVGATDVPPFVPPGGFRLKIMTPGKIALSWDSDFPSGG